MELLTKVTEIESQDDEQIIFTTTIREAWPYDDALKRQIELGNKIQKNKGEIAEAERIIKEEQIQKDIIEMNRGIAMNEALLGTFADALKPYTDKMDKEGRIFIHAEKLRKHFDRMSDGEDKRATQVQILNDCREKLKLADIAHPIIQKLRMDFENI